MSLSNGTIDMIRVILSSNLRPIEKLFLTIEWFLREQKPYELYRTKLIELERKGEILVKNQMPSDLRQMALKEGAEIFQTRSNKKLLALLMALSYYSYIANEVVYDHGAREELMAKILELGFRQSEIRRLNDKWTKVAGSSEELFNKIFLKRSVQSD